MIKITQQIAGGSSFSQSRRRTGRTVSLLSIGITRADSRGSMLGWCCSTWYPWRDSLGCCCGREVALDENLARHLRGFSQLKKGGKGAKERATHNTVRCGMNICLCIELASQDVVAGGGEGGDVFLRGLVFSELKYSHYSSLQTCLHNMHSR